MKIELERVLRAIEDAAWVFVERAMRDNATADDIATAAAAVRTAAMTRRKWGASSEVHEGITAEYLIGLSLRLMELDDGGDLNAVAYAADVISPQKPLDRT